MTDVGTDLGVDCASLWLCARSFLPMVADAFIGGNGQVAGTASGDGAFSRLGWVPGLSVEVTVPGPVQPAWAQARDELQRVMAKTAQNIYDTCDALVRVADIYAAVDGDAAANIKYTEQKQIYLHNAATMHPGDPDYLRLEDPNQRPTAKLPG
jgi:hypothetical protein